MNKAGTIKRVMIVLFYFIFIGVQGMELVIDNDPAECRLPSEMQQLICAYKETAYMKKVNPAVGLLLFVPSNAPYRGSYNREGKVYNSSTCLYECMTLHTLSPNTYSTLDSLLKVGYVWGDGKYFQCIAQLVKKPDHVLFDQRAYLYTAKGISTYVCGQIIAGNYNNRWYIRSLFKEKMYKDIKMIQSNSVAYTKKIKEVKAITCLALHQHLASFIYGSLKEDHNYYITIVKMCEPQCISDSKQMHTVVAQEKAPINFKIIYPLTDRLYIGLGVEGNVYSLFQDGNTIEYSKKNIIYFDGKKYVTDHFDQLAVDTYERSKQMILVNKDGMPFYLNIKKPFSDNNITLHKIGNSNTMSGRIWFYKDKIGELTKSINKNATYNGRYEGVDIDYKWYDFNYFILRERNIPEKLIATLQQVSKCATDLFMQVKNQCSEYYASNPKYLKAVPRKQLKSQQDNNQ